jgi:hypothetical protein
MEIIGRIVKVLPLQSGEGKNGHWTKQEFVIETDGQYPKKICIQSFNEKVDPNILTIGTMLKIQIEVESREYNEKWFTNVSAWKAEVVGVSPVNNVPSYTPPYDPVSTAFENQPVAESDLPF